jgi:hypothetical protein
LRDEPPPPVPPLRVERPSLAADRAPAPRRSDVVLPRTAVVLWSFFVLLALVLAFASGLLAGHYLWTSPPRAAGDSGPAPAPPAHRAK